MQYRLLVQKSFEFKHGIFMEQDAFGKLRTANDKLEEINAYFEKRKPVYTGE